MAIILAEMNIVSKKKIEEEETKERYIVHVEYMDYVYGASRVLTVFIL